MLTIRTLFICTFVLIFAVWAAPYSSSPRSASVACCGLASPASLRRCLGSCITGIEAGSEATVAPIDKGSVVVAMLMAWLLLREVITLRMLVGAGLIVAGLLVSPDQYP
ncbi:TPA: EamA family transporter [Pseudomonas aeruginosa]|uniref:EamA family transporter n=1 Tax=Stutzerimonas stutzeri TaxID=316 RepID=UPI001645DAAA|nr:EamA family transporter [Stutzerimonas stutzeri]HCL4246418.1 EamA family transporter [Pseudomonas aeruginosa]